MFCTGTVPNLMLLVVANLSIPEDHALIDNDSKNIQTQERSYPDGHSYEIPMVLCIHS